MTGQQVFEALGGGITGVLGAALLTVCVLLFWELKGQIKELRDANQELRDSVKRLADVVESWSPEAQRRRLRS